MAQDVNQSEMDVATQVRLTLVARISHERFDLWMPEECRWQFAGGALTLWMPNDFLRQLSKRMLHDELRTALTSVVGEAAILNWEIEEQLDDELALTTDEPTTHELSATPIASHGDEHLMGSSGDEDVVTVALPAVKPRSALRVESRSTSEAGAEATEHDARWNSNQWNEFIAGPANQMAWRTINLIANEPGKMTPLLLHGPFGVGKTHLANALVQRLRTEKRQRRVVHISAEQFTNDFTEALRGSGLPMMRRKYRDVDTLVMDDLQFLFNKKATIGELKFTLDNLLKNNRQVVFLSDRSLSDLEPLGADFTGRLRGGLVTPLLPLDEETRYKILKRDLNICQVALSDDIVLQIAARAIGDGRLLKGIVKRLMATSYINDHPLTWDECWNAIYDLIQATQPIVRLGDIERVVCEVFGLEPESLQSDRKTRQVSQPRMLAMFLARKYTPAAYQEIGEYFGNRRHSTVISAEKTVGAWLEENTRLQLPRGTLGIRDALRHVEANLHVG